MLSQDDCKQKILFNRDTTYIITKVKENSVNILNFYMLDDQATAKICIPKIIFNICDARKMRSDEVFLYILVYIISKTNFSRTFSKLKNCTKLRKSI